jgi:hypothetical protein
MKNLLSTKMKEMMTLWNTTRAIHPRKEKQGVYEGHYAMLLIHKKATDPFGTHFKSKHQHNFAYRGYSWIAEKHRDNVNVFRKGRITREESP